MNQNEGFDINLICPHLGKGMLLLQFHPFPNIVVSHGTVGWNKAKELEKAADELTNAEMIMIGKKSGGVIKVIPRADELHFHQMQILPEYQNGGIGTELVRRVIKRSEISNKPITLVVMKNTPAKLLYEQYGFSVTNDFEYHCRMCRQPT